MYDVSDICCLMSGVKHQTPDIRHLTSDNKHQTLYIRHQMSEIIHHTSDHDIRCLSSGI